MVLVLDNYDSFTYNLVQYLGHLGACPVVCRNDQVTVDEAEAMSPSRVVISPGPGRPEQAGISVELIRRLAPRMPVLGVCLGHQAIGVAFGGTVRRHSEIRHGKCSPVAHDGRGVFDGLEQGFAAARYHSLVVSEDGLPADLEVGARATDDGAVMGLRHQRWPAHGVQFHPESILTDVGCRLMQTFLEI
ncbi:MAG: aminodeoxychorismate/anthranilate synthase component II [Vicinamibacterales bacterium]|jgi:anthranilate synthase/aminodeoxychorismate synthase-like glutamine amidotransferase|nr:aminodeoxychorismate/anthranilate synthase component II [Acidobacteriota bacterium]MDP6608752.1 aminodeoxychorismate/anthranilate synthase component II [Vicinamibacterales bacterium]HAK56664.1 aminodeoxychorismate/anthranilate synthase component II [Acidobacteriota bacterium]|tara:strand:- start:31808 stop:32374 length:567 start_codon:yes stop_codon:yes gene_type:complete